MRSCPRGNRLHQDHWPVFTVNEEVKTKNGHRPIYVNFESKKDVKNYRSGHLRTWNRYGATIDHLGKFFPLF